MDKIVDEIDWEYFSEYSNAIHLLEKHKDKIDWSLLSRNPNAFAFIRTKPPQNKFGLICLQTPTREICWKKHIDTVMNRFDWSDLSRNPSAIALLERNFDKIDWYELSANPNARRLLEQNQDKINWYSFTEYNPCLLIYDYDAMKKATSLFHEELIQKVLHPRRLMKYLEQYNYDIASEEYYSAF